MFPHDHRFDGQDQPEIEVTGQRVYVYDTCHEDEVVDSMTDHRRDETYEVIGETCTAQRIREFIPETEITDHVELYQVVELLPDELVLQHEHTGETITCHLADTDVNE